MSRTLPSGVAAVATAREYTAWYAVELGTSPPLRYTECPTGLVIAGNLYTPRELGPIAQQIEQSPPMLRITTPNADNAISSADLTSTIIGSPVTVYEVHLSASGTQLDPVVVFEGVVETLVADEASASLECVSEVSGAQAMVGRLARRHCMHVFKGARCGYAGTATWCDHSIQRCAQLNNTSRWGGVLALAPYRGQVIRWQVAQAAPSQIVGIRMPPPQPDPPPVRAPRIVLPRSGSGPAVRVIRRP